MNEYGAPYYQHYQSARHIAGCYNILSDKFLSPQSIIN